jgi:hypothetical protein
MMKQLRRFRNNRNGIILVGVVAICFIVLSSIVWLAGLLIVNKTFDAFGPWFAVSDPRALVVANQALTAYSVSIVVTDVMFLIWWGLASQKRESEESPGMTYYG